MAISATATIERRNPPEEELYSRRWPIFTVSAIGAFLAYLDATIVNIAVPELQRVFNTDIVTVSWIVNAYNIAFAVPLVAMARLADQFGRRRLMLVGLVLFGAGSLGCALAPSISFLIGARVVQGLGASILVPLTLATTIMIFPPDQRGRGVAIQGVIANLGAVAGPVAGGLLLQYASWPWIFWINVPVCAIVFVLARRIVPETFDPAAGRRVDVAGMVLLGGSVFALSLACVKGNSWGWHSAPTLSLFAATVVLAIGFYVSQRRGRSPMVPGILARNRQFVSAVGAFVLFTLGALGTFFLLIVGMVELWGYTELKAALATLAVPGGAMLVAPFVARMSDRVAPRLLLVPATLITAAAVVRIADFPSHANYLRILPALIVFGAGIGTVVPVGFAGGMGRLTGQEFGLGSGLLNVARALGTAIGVALIAAIFTAALTPRLSDARAQLTRTAVARGYPPAVTRPIVGRLQLRTLRSRSAPVPPAVTPLVAEGRRLAQNAASDSFGIAFDVAAGIIAAATLLVAMMRSRVSARI